MRGFAPGPTQPPPLYPPGQFAAWNQHPDDTADPASRPAGVARHAAPADAADHAGPPAAQAGPPASAAGPLAARPGPRPGSGSRGRHSQPEGRRAQPGGSAVSRYYAREADAQPDPASPDPGYPVLAVSDPAADVTSTQTWRAIAEGRSTGIWAAPADLRADGGNATAAGPAVSARSGPRTAPRSGPNTAPRSGPNAPPRSGPQTGPFAAPRSGPHTGPFAAPRSGPHTGPQAAPRSGPHTGPFAAPDTKATPTRNRTARPGRSRPSGPRGWPLSVRMSMAGALVLVLAAAGVLGYYVVHIIRSHPRPPAAASSQSKASASASPSASLGPYGHIATRQSDPQPLAIAQLYPSSYVDNGATVTSTAASLSTDCSGAITGATLQTAVSWAGCSQVARATYVSVKPGLMGTIGVLNLTTAPKAKTAVQSADANDYISQLPGPNGPTHKIGQGTGIEEAAAKGHYLILIWAQLTTLAKPNAAQTAELESFMTDLLHNTANVSLSQRLLVGTP